MPLGEYHKKRHFNRTPEPKGKVARQKGKGRRFVVQKHDATRLHYDFRLEMEGVLKSWAVPKGPSYDPKEKRLAVEVEDHPLDYARFEGTIPEGEYGGGTVAVWDEGTWEPDGDPVDGYRQGKLKFHLNGAKLRGAWTIVRMRRRAGDRATNWLLIKERDDTARPLEEYDVTEAEPASVVTGRMLDEIARDNDRVWMNNRAVRVAKKVAGEEAGHMRRRSSKKVHPASDAPVVAPPVRRGRVASADAPEQLDSGAATTERQGHQRVHKLPGRRATMSETVELQLATLVKEPPSGDQWAHEIKFDGYRILCRIDRGKVKLITRGGQNWTGRMPALVAAAKKLPVERAILDGEVVALEPNGVSSFQRLQTAFRDKRAGELIYYVFDLLYLDGHDLRASPLEERKSILAELLSQNTAKGSIRYVEHLNGQGDKFFREACRMGLEGIISKRRDRQHIAGRGFDWTKTKCVRSQEFVIGGYTDPEGSRRGLGALLVGYYNSARRLTYAGKVGTGFSERLLNDLRKRLDGLQRNETPFANFATHLPRKAHWVKPVLVAQIEFSNWTDDGRLRHPSFQGLREDKSPTGITRETPQDVTSVPSESARKATIAKGRKQIASRRSGKAWTAKTNVADADNQSVAGIRLTSPDRLLYPEQDVTKFGLATFYSQIADWILPHVIDRPLSLLRCPEGQRKTCFFQKHLDEKVAPALRRVAIQEKDKLGQYAVVNDLSGIIALVQMSALEIHLWGCRANDIERPDRLVFDLDPDPGIEWSRIVDAAHRVRDLLHSVDLESFVKTSGGKGLHVVVPVVGRREWPEIKAFCKAVAKQIADTAPDLYTINPLKARRKGRVFVDYLRNERGATSVAAYSTRAREGAPVSVPIDWKELKVDLRADYFNIENVPDRLAHLEHDPWRELPKLRQSITAAAMKAVAANA